MYINATALRYRRRRASNKSTQDNIWSLKAAHTYTQYMYVCLPFKSSGISQLPVYHRLLWAYSPTTTTAYLHLSFVLRRSCSGRTIDGGCSRSCKWERTALRVEVASLVWYSPREHRAVFKGAAAKIWWKMIGIFAVFSTTNIIRRSRQDNFVSRRPGLSLRFAIYLTNAIPNRAFHPTLRAPPTTPCSYLGPGYILSRPTHNLFLGVVNIVQVRAPGPIRLYILSPLSSKIFAVELLKQECTLVGQHYLVDSISTTPVLATSY